MPANRPAPKKDWRSPQGVRPARLPASRKGLPWLTRRDRRHEGAVLRQRAKLAAYLVALATMLVGFVLIIIFWPVPTPTLVVRVTEYSAPIPPNSWAAEDATRLLGLQDQHRILNCTELVWESPEQGLRRLQENLDAVKPGGPRRYYIGPRRNLVILYLSVHGVVDSEGRACVVLPGAGPKEDHRWLPVVELLERLFQEARQGQPAPEVKKLLVLDSHKIQSCWPLGVLQNSFSDRLAEAVEQAEVPNLWVLAAAGSGQRAWSAPELGGSVFATFFSRGIEGAADRATTGNGDGIVSLHELEAYLQTCVDHWVREYRSATQTPVVHGPRRDILLTYTGRAAEAPDAVTTGTAADVRWEEIADRWRRHENLAKQSPWNRAPLRWAQLEHKLLRLEMLVSAGRAYGEQYQQTRERVDALVKQLEAGAQDYGVPAYSLAMQGALLGQPEPAAVEAVPTPWRPAGDPRQRSSPAETPRVGRPGAPGAEPAVNDGNTQDTTKADPPGDSSDGPLDAGSAVPGELTGEPRGEPSSPDAPYSYFPAAVAVWDRCRESPASETIDEALAFLSGAVDPPVVEPMEIHMLRMLREYLDGPVWGLEGGAFVRNALHARALAEQASAPRDIRAAYWSRPLVDATDRQRREAEDRLFVGDHGVLDQTRSGGEEWIGPEGAYQQSIRLAENVAAAFQLRDRAFARLPYLAEWLMEARLEKTNEDRLLGVLKAALEDVHQLAAGLDRELQEAAWPEEQHNLVERLRKGLARLEKAYADESLSTRGGDMESLARIRTALRQPLVTGSRRNALRRTYHRIVADIRPPDARYAPDPARKPDGPSDDLHGTIQRRFDLLGQRHPAVKLLSRESLGKEPGKEPRKTLEQQGRLVRQLLHGSTRPQPVEAPDVLAQAEQWVRESAEAMHRESDAGQSLRTQYVAIREPCSRADRLVRAAAALLAPRPREGGTPPANRLQRLDLHHLLVWQAERTVEDFWGPRPGYEKPYFESASHGWLAAAERLFPKSGPARLVGGQREARAAAARVGVRPEKPEHAYYEEDDKTVEHQVAVHWPEGIPQGMAAFHLQHPAESPSSAVPRIVGTGGPGARRSAVALSGEGGRMTVGPYQVSCEQLRNTIYLDAVSLYRGSAQRVRCDFLPLDVTVVAPEFPADQAPRITVRGERSPEICVMFVFDCSGSMKKPADPKQPKGRRRLQVARDAMLETVRALNGPESPYHVGLMLYGHRTQWRPDPKGPFPRPRGGFDYDTFPPDLKDEGVNPANDVELVVPMDRLPNVNRRITEVLRAANARGETPLYRSIGQAMEAMPPRVEGRERRIVVLTDGKNEQFDEFERRFVLEDVVDERQRHRDIQLDVVGFQLPRGEKDDLDRLTQAAEETGGRYHDAVDAESLIDALRQSLGLKRFAVTRLPEKEKVAEAELGRTVDVEQPREDAPQWFGVSVAELGSRVETEFDLWGGEAIVLELRERPNRRLVHLPFESPWGRRDEVRADISGEPFEIVAHQPYRDPKDLSSVRFAISVENVNRERFSPRPVEIWAEIRPIGNSLPAGAPTYVFYDPTFLNDKPVPVLEFVASDWQGKTGGATEAEIRLWLKFQRTSADQERIIAELSELPLLLDGTTFRIDRGKESGEFRILEQHDDPERFDWAKVEILPRPKAMLRRYSPMAGRCSHVFTVDVGPLYTVRVTTREKWTAGAVALPRPLQVKVPRPGS